MLICVFIFSNLNAQIKPISKNKGSQSNDKFLEILKKTPWTVGVSGNVVDDDGKPFKNLFNVGQTWNFLPYPTKLSINGYVKNGFNIQGEFAFNKYNAGKNINSEIINSKWNFLSIDMNLQYELKEVIKKNMKWFDPYLTAGYGYTKRSGAQKPNTFTFNTGIGFNIWIVDFLALNLQSVGKFSMIEGTSNYLHHSAGLIYTLNWGMNAKNTIVGNRNGARSKLRTKY